MPAGTTNPLDLSGRTILVTGASSGIGRATAILLSQLNGRLVLTGRNPERLEETRRQLAGDGHRAVPFDLSCLDGIVPWLKEVTAETGPLGGIVHSAGLGPTVPLRVLSPQKAEEIMKVNALAAMMLARGFRQRGCCAREGRLVFLSSVAAVVGRPGLAAYAASKAALNGLVRALAKELAPEGIRVNCIAPAWVKTEMMEQYTDSISAEQLKAAEAAHPLGLGTPLDVAYAVAFLLAQTGRWITGTTLVVDGGYSA